MFKNIWLNNWWRLCFKHNFFDILTGWKIKSHTALRGAWTFWGYPKFHLFNQRILDSCNSSWTQCFGIWPRLQQSFPCSINQYHSEWWTTYQDPDFYVSIFLIYWREGRGSARERNISFSALLFTFFPCRVHCHVIPYQVLFSHKKLERVV